MVNTAREPRAYELMTIVVPELAEEDLTNQIQKIGSHITTATGAIKETLTDSPWGRRRLAYSVRHNSQDYRDGYYVVFHFDLAPGRMTDIERELKLDVNVMRYLLVHDDPKAGEKNTARANGADGAAEANAADGAAGSASGEPASVTATEQRLVTDASAPVPAEEIAPGVAADAEPDGQDAAALGEAVSEGRAPDSAEATSDAPAPAPDEPVLDNDIPAVEALSRADGALESPASAAPGDPTDVSNDDAKQEG